MDIDLRLGNCLELMDEIPDGSIDMIITDLPYGVSRNSGYVNNSADKIDYIRKYGNHKIDFGKWDTKEIDLDELAEIYYRILKVHGVVVVFYDIWAASEVKSAFKKFKQPRILEWVKKNPVPINSKLNFLSNAKEYMFSFVKKSKPTFNSKYNKGIFEYTIVHGKVRTDHPTQKPVELIMDLIKIYTNENETVLDSTMGSGTTAIACMNTNRNFIGMEIDESYLAMAQNRVKKKKEENLQFALFKGEKKR